MTNDDNQIAGVEKLSNDINNITPTAPTTAYVRFCARISVRRSRRVDGEILPSIYDIKTEYTA
ncbi:hypothetical protein HFX_1498 [Haloferax mediterranei ATCC 33500]|uniref:Uncharacterized protein n=1 Tax=Haloferax mediterranei (strain ATCC 33500 / DSM 1411 / JCM 8866 / NBRC 14739 / NCIMB 2177 / R-4) TaxID=523841 RepID=I3R4P6_HALMT|nr:hypothetical protein HFX_1498 [Haloferax mediterranei ATCC 33500]